MLKVLAVAYAAWAVAGIAIQLSGVGASYVVGRHVSPAKVSDGRLGKPHPILIRRHTSCWVQTAVQYTRSKTIMPKALFAVNSVSRLAKTLFRHRFEKSSSIHGGVKAAGV